MKAEEIRDLSDEELKAKAEELRNELFNVKVKRSTGQLENSAKLKSLRHDIARLETVMGERSGATDS